MTIQIRLTSEKFTKIYTMNPEVQLTHYDPDALPQVITHYEVLTTFVSQFLREGIDYGTIPRAKRPTLLKPGAEKLCQLFNLRASFTQISAIEDWTGKAHGLDEPLFHYAYQCVLSYPKTEGQPVGEGTGSCNSLEVKYRGSNWRFDLVNTIDKMAQKRSLVAAVLVTVGASEFFTQDVEDWQQTLSGTTENPQERERAIAQVGTLVQQIGWSTQQAQTYLKQHYGVVSRNLLTLPQLKQVIYQLSRTMQES